MGCIDVCLEKKERNSGIKQLLGVCLVEAIRVRV